MQARKIRFERHASQVVFDPSMHAFVVTWTKCGLAPEQRIAGRKDPMSWLPSIGAISDLYDRGCVPPGQTVCAAMAIGKAYDAGDRDMLDTEEAKKAAELVRDLSYMCVDMTSPAVSRDVGQAMRHLLDEMAAVRFMNSDMRDFDESKVMPAMDKACAECFAEEGFAEWPAKSMRRRFLFCLNRKERTPVAYTILALMFDAGACPLLSLSDRRILRMKAMEESGMASSFTPSSVHSFMSFVLERMKSAKAEGRSRIRDRITQQQLADSLA